MVSQKCFAVSSAVMSAVLGISLALTSSAAGKADSAKGKQIFGDQCAVCHNADTDEKKMGPSLKGLFKRAKLSSGKPVNDANVAAQINNGGNGMPPYADSLSADDKANLMAYLHTL